MNYQSYRVMSDGFESMARALRYHREEARRREEMEALLKERSAERARQQQSEAAAVQRWETERADRLAERREARDPLAPYRRIVAARAALRSERETADPSRHPDIDGQLSYLSEMEASLRAAERQSPGVQAERQQAESAKERELRRMAEILARDPMAPVNRLREKRAQLARERSGAPTERQSEIDQDMEYLMRQERGMMTPPAPPMAKVTQKMGDTTVVRDMPTTDLERSFGEIGYKSPYEGDIVELDRQIAQQQAEMSGGDMRTGFLGIGSSRKDIVAKASRQRLALKARELQDMLERGVIDQAEADRRAALLMPQ